MSDLALILCHKQATSARLRFVRFGDSVIAAHLTHDEAGTVPHPGGLIPATVKRTGLSPGDIRLDPEFEATLLASEGALTVRLGELTTIDPPFEALAAVDGRFVGLTEIRGIPDTERDVLRLVYEHMIG